MNKVALIALFAVMLLYACRKDDSEIENPIITVGMPTATQFHVNDTVFVYATATDRQEMHTFKAWLLSVADSDTLWSTSKHGHSSQKLTINDFYVITQQQHLHNEALNLVLVAENETGNITTETRVLQIQH